MSEIYGRLNAAAEAAEVKEAPRCQLFGPRVEAKRHFEWLLKQPAAAQQTMVWNTQLKAHANAGDVAGAERLYQQMLARGVRVNEKTYGTSAGVRELTARQVGGVCRQGRPGGSGRALAGRLEAYAAGARKGVGSCPVSHAWPEALQRHGGCLRQGRALFPWPWGGRRVTARRP